ncbi:MAG: ZIP family metal transporter [Candidatus Peregrinibacteria bacterium]
MSEVWVYSLASVLAVSLISVVGVLTIALGQKMVKGLLLFMVSFAAGALLGDVFIHLLPEMIEEDCFHLENSLYVLLGILMFFVLEKIMHWRHCHLAAAQDHIHPLATMNLVGDALHNFIDGILIASSYLLSIPVGIATTIAVILHEIPQEMGDFGVLLHSGVTFKKALALNFLTALTAVFGALLILGLDFKVDDIICVVIPVTMGGFLYIANADLIPELHKDVKPINSIIQLISFLAGIGVMLLLLSIG